MNKKIGILGGTFNPIHNGHLKLAEQSILQFGLDRVLVLPNNLPAYKDTADIISNVHRRRMIELAIVSHTDLQLSTIEMDRAGFSYTIDTLHELSALYPDCSFYFILGADSLFTFHQWRSYKQILKLTNLICATRNDSKLADLQTAKARLEQQCAGCNIEFLQGDIPKVSSSEIRKNFYQMREEEQLYALPEPVLRYILEQHLYTNTVNS